ncbi:hypothetical protein SBA3_2700017 [Candidatus Sulfopaludibacter sp. SbA3]|nr:hypothetical protein SBA3_2700017 [Candidatus Sulfopaludibacter sp. SbA3]
MFGSSEAPCCLATICSTWWASYLPGADSNIRNVRHPAWCAPVKSEQAVKDGSLKGIELLSRIRFD